MNGKNKLYPKYILLKDQSLLAPGSRRVYRIRAARDLGSIENGTFVKQGTLGGFVRSEDNLSHNGDCWIADDARAEGSSRVTKNAQLKNRARLSDNAVATDNAIVKDSAWLMHHARVVGNGVVDGEKIISGKVVIGHTSATKLPVIPLKRTGRSYVSRKPRLYTPS